MQPDFILIIWGAKLPFITILMVRKENAKYIVWIVKSCIS